MWHVKPSYMEKSREVIRDRDESKGQRSIQWNKLHMYCTHPPHTANPMHVYIIYLVLTTYKTHVWSLWQHVALIASMMIASDFLNCRNPCFCFCTHAKWMPAGVNSSFFLCVFTGFYVHACSARDEDEETNVHLQRSSLKMLFRVFKGEEL